MWLSNHYVRNEYKIRLNVDFNWTIKIKTFRRPKGTNNRFWDTKGIAKGKPSRQLRLKWQCKETGMLEPVKAQALEGNPRDFFNLLFLFIFCQNLHWLHPTTCQRTAKLRSSLWQNTLPPPHSSQSRPKQKAENELGEKRKERQDLNGEPKGPQLMETFCSKL